MFASSPDKLPKDVLPREAAMAEPYAHWRVSKDFRGLFDHEDIRHLAQRGMEDIKLSDPATYEKMLANVPLDSKESFLGSFFTGGASPRF